MIVHRISCAVEDNGQVTLDHQNWIPANRVLVSVDIKHRGTSIILKYFVREPQVIAVNTEYNSAVWEDSCVEFFIALEGDNNYYNFEFNAIGTVLGAYGPDRHSREWLPVESLENIATTPSLGNGIIKNMEGDLSWELHIVLPVSTFCHHKVTDLAGLKTTANFYKCGDGLKQPHFLSWQPVLTEKPDFHLPQYFGELVFE